MMNRTLIWIGVSGLIIGAGITTFFLVRKKPVKDIDADDAGDTANAETKIKTESGIDPNNRRIIPIFNNLKWLSNTFNEIRGLTLQAKNEGVAIRSSAEVNTGIINNEIARIGKGRVIGSIVSQKTDDFIPPHRWFKVKFPTPYKTLFSEHTYGWVRDDNVTFTPFQLKKSGASGYKEMIPDISFPIEKYKATQSGLIIQNHCEIDLGAQVLSEM